MEGGMKKPTKQTGKLLLSNQVNEGKGGPHQAVGIIIMEGGRKTAIKQTGKLLISNHLFRRLVIMLGDISTANRACGSFGVHRGW